MRKKKKKVLIISKNAIEYSTEIIMDWIFYLGHEVERLNGDTFENSANDIFIDSEASLKVRINNNTVKNDYYSIWIRRWSDYSNVSNLINKADQLKTTIGLGRTLSNCLLEDTNAVRNSVLRNFKGKKYLSTPSQLSVNKINVLQQAKKCGFNIPKFIFTNRKKYLAEFIKEKENVIIKDLEGQFSLFQNDKAYMSYAELLDEDKFNQLPDEFCLSFFQEYIEKEYEIRTFVLENKLYSMAIFSQKDKQTKVDFRRYNFDTPNRAVPYQLPKHIEKKALQLMRIVGLNTGSIDILKSENGNYYFLEVNPVGQFGMVSEPCNYNLEYEIANYLTT